MKSESKPWIDFTGNDASCERCGGKSRFVPGCYDTIGRKRELTWYKWRKRFKQAHAKCGRQLTAEEQQALDVYLSKKKCHDANG